MIRLLLPVSIVCLLVISPAIIVGQVKDFNPVTEEILLNWVIFPRMLNYRLGFKALKINWLFVFVLFGNFFDRFNYELKL